MVYSRLGKVLLLSALSVILFSTSAYANCRREERKVAKVERKIANVNNQFGRIQAKLDHIAFSYDRQRDVYVARMQLAQDYCNAGFSSSCRTAENIQNRVLPRIEQKKQRAQSRTLVQRDRLQFKVDVLGSESAYWTNLLNLCLGV